MLVFTNVLENLLHYFLLASKNTFNTTVMDSNPNTTDSEG